MNKKFFSIIVPVYNVRLYVENTINSMINQTFDNYEIILIDDGSTDGSSEICMKYANEFNDRIKFIQQQNEGVGAARNKGLENAEGEYILFLDGDDQLSFDTLALLNETLNTINAGIVFFDYEKVNSGYKLDSLNEINNKINYDILNKNQVIEMKLSQALIPCVASCYRNRELQQYKIRFDTSLAYVEDALFFFSALVRTNSAIVHLKQCLYKYVQRQDSAVNIKIKSVNKLLTELDGWKLIGNLFGEHHSQFLKMVDMRVLEVRYRLIFYFIDLYSNNFILLTNDEKKTIEQFVRNNRRISFKFKKCALFTQKPNRGVRGVISAYLFCINYDAYKWFKRNFARNI